MNKDVQFRQAWVKNGHQTKITGPLDHCGHIDRNFHSYNSGAELATNNEIYITLPESGFYVPESVGRERGCLKRRWDSSRNHRVKFSTNFQPK